MFALRIKIKRLTAFTKQSVQIRNEYKADAILQLHNVVGYYIYFKIILFIIYIYFN